MTTEREKAFEEFSDGLSIEKGSFDEDIFNMGWEAHKKLTEQGNDRWIRAIGMMGHPQWEVTDTKPSDTKSWIHLREIKSD